MYDDSEREIARCVGRTIKGVAIKDNELTFDFGAGEQLKLLDEGQSCCESRYMTCDDDLRYYIGSKFMGAEVRDGDVLKVTEHYYDNCHDTAFLIITTSLGSFTVVNHNEHNGWYGGFDIEARASVADDVALAVAA